VPSVSERQRRYFGAELGRARAGAKTQTGLPETKLKDFAKAVKPSPAKAAAERQRKVPKVKKNPSFEPNPPVKRPNPLGRY